MQWYYSSNGSQQGPVSEDDLKAKITSGEVRSADLVWKEGMEGWQAVSKVPELQAVSPGVMSSTPNTLGVPESSRSVEASPYQTPNSPVLPRMDSSQGGDIPSYLWQSITVTLLCCLPFGIVAIIYAAKVDGLKQIGDFQAARNASNSAKLWVNLSAGVVLALVVISVLVNLLGLAASSH